MLYAILIKTFTAPLTHRPTDPLTYCPTEMSHPYFAFLLRLWKSADASRWQASLEDPHTRQVIGFDDLERLNAFLEQLQPVEVDEGENQPSSGYNNVGVKSKHNRG